MSDRYWLGPGVLIWRDKKKAGGKIWPDEKISKKALRSLGDAKVAKLEEKGLIGKAPKSTFEIIARRNANKALKQSLENEKKSAKNLDKALNEIDVFEGKLEKLVEENKELSDDNAELEKENKRWMKLDKALNVSLNKHKSASGKLYKPYDQILELAKKPKKIEDAFNKLNNLFEKVKTLNDDFYRK